ncbi:4-phosphoerythronate dehydrogenase [Proteobacteria bacterium 005FR1]|nr:4-phosphoerythronate dehydrogenase [Proteobacteria bacterium 005FR1]
MKIVADENIPLIHEFFDSLGQVDTVPPRQLSRAHTEGADMLVMRSVVAIGRELLENTPVKFVGTCTAGIDHLDTKAMDELGIAWSGAPGCNANAVGDYVFSSLAALNVDFLNGSVGIIGCGNVGGRLYRRLAEMNVDCHCYDPFLTIAEQPSLTSLEQILQSDIICIHAPLTQHGPHPSFHLLGDRELAQLKKGAVLISAGRGGVVDNRALGELLKRRDDLQIVLDVWESEPQVDKELFRQSTLGTPHIAGHSYNGKVRGTEIIYQKACEFLNRPVKKTFAELDPHKPAEPIRLQNSEPMKAMREAILAVYDMRRDHQAFEQALQGEGSSREAFDRLRKHYPIRREFSDYRVELAAPDATLERDLRALGFEVK